jgi:Carboxypeptidase regulatory-like domain
LDSSGNAIVGATVTFSGGSATTDSSGWDFGQVTAQDYTVTVDASAQGYVPESLSITVTAGGADTLTFYPAANTPPPTPTPSPSPT